MTGIDWSKIAQQGTTIAYDTLLAEIDQEVKLDAEGRTRLKIVAEETARYWSQSLQGNEEGARRAYRHATGEMALIVELYAIKASAARKKAAIHLVGQLLRLGAGLIPLLAAA